MPRAALFSIHARVEGTEPDAWQHSSLVQIWGPRYSAYVVAEEDRAFFTLGRLPDAPARRKRALDLARRLQPVLANKKITYTEAGRMLGESPNMLRYAAPTGTLLIRWDGAARPVMWAVPAPDVDPLDARVELARRYVHIFGPTTTASFKRWAGIGAREAATAFERLTDELLPVTTMIGPGVILASDEAAFRAPGAPAAPARLLPSGDTYYLVWGDDRDLLVPDAAHRAALWTSRVWPGAVLVEGEIVGIWRRSQASVTIESWRRLSAWEREAVAGEASSLPVPGVDRTIAVHWGP